jgi:hypothetical protein
LLQATILSATDLIQGFFGQRGSTLPGEPGAPCGVIANAKADLSHTVTRNQRFWRARLASRSYKCTASRSSEGAIAGGQGYSVDSVIPHVQESENVTEGSSVS